MYLNDFGKLNELRNAGYKITKKKRDVPSDFNETKPCYITLKKGDEQEEFKFTGENADTAMHLPLTD
jgi:hypothetical protein